MFCGKNSCRSKDIDVLVPPDGVSHVYDIIKDEFSSAEPIINDILSRIFARHGKGIRTTFMAIAAGMVGGSWKSLGNAPAVIEAIHLASLLHDDVVDDSEMRRGEPTINAVHSNKISVLFGDYIFTRSLMMAQEIKCPEAIPIIHSAVNRMVEGEILDILSGDVIDEGTYFKIITLKTASLFAASGELGVVMSGVNGIERLWARELGESLGMAFQIIDDTLDFNGDSEMMGKPVFKDIVSGNMTLPLIYSLRGYSADEIKMLLLENRGSCEELSNIVRVEGGVEYAYEKAREYSHKALEIVGRYGNTKVQSLFEWFLTQLMNRAF